MKKTAVRRKSPKTKTRKNKRQKKHRKNLKKRGGVVGEYDVVTGITNGIGQGFAAVGTGLNVVGTGFRNLGEGTGIISKDNRTPQQKYCDFEHKSKNPDGSTRIDNTSPIYSTCLINRQTAIDECLKVPDPDERAKCENEKYMKLKANSSCIKKKTPWQKEICVDETLKGYNAYISQRNLASYKP